MRFGGLGILFRTPSLPDGLFQLDCPSVRILTEDQHLRGGVQRGHLRGGVDRVIQSG